jgi:hypothetical protein
MVARRRLATEVAEEAEDEAGGDPVESAGVLHGVAEAGHEHLEADVPGGVGLGIEEDLGVQHAVGGRPLEIGRHQVGEVVTGLEYLRSLVVDVEERLQVGEPVGRLHRFRRREREGSSRCAARANIISGSSVPSMWTWSSALGSGQMFRTASSVKIGD